MERPPPARAPLGRPTVLTDLPGDVLAYILSFIPFEERGGRGLSKRVVVSRFAAAAACTALAAAARPPSAAWTDVDIPQGFFFDIKYVESRIRCTPVAAQHALRDALARAAPSVRRLALGRGVFSHFTNANVPALMVAMAAPAAPFLEELALRVEHPSDLSMFELTLAAATRLTRLDLNHVNVEGPPPMISAERAAIIAFRRDVDVSWDDASANYFDALLALLRSLSATAIPGMVVEPPVLVRLDPLCLTPRMHLEQAGFVLELTSVFGRHLTRLAVRCRTAEDDDELRDPATHAETRTAVARLLENRALPALRELVIDWKWSLYGVPLDLAAVHAPPPGLTFLSVRNAFFHRKLDVLLSPAIRADLASLAVQCPGHSTDPPRCLRGAGGSFGRLTRLVYGMLNTGNESVNLASLGRPEFSVPTLVEMEVSGRCFTLNELGRWDRGSWCEGFLAALPRLARLVLRSDAYTGGSFRASTDGSTDAAAVQNMITARLPQAARDSGRRLDVAVHHRPPTGDPAALLARFGWPVDTHLHYGFQLAFEARPPG
jgi:hypothetical protein